MNKMKLKFEILFLFLAMFFFLPEIHSQEINELEKQKQEEDLEWAKLRTFYENEGLWTVFDWAKFDWTKLGYIVCCNKTEYSPGEPVFLKYPIKRPSFGEHKEEIFWLTNQFQLANLNDNVNKTEFGKYAIISKFESRPIILLHLLREYVDDATAQETDTVSGTRGPGEEPLHTEPKEETSTPFFSLNQFFDFSQSGDYFFSSIEYPSGNFRRVSGSKKSNTVSFRIKSGPPFTSNGLKEPGTWEGVTEKSFERFDDLPPLGDYSKLKYVLRTNKTTYKEAEPVFLRLFLKNESEDTISICVGGDPCWMAQSWSLTYRVDEVLASILSRFEGSNIESTKRSFIDRYNQITREGPRPKLRLGQLRFPDTSRDAAEVDWVFDKPCFVKLAPGEEVEMEPGEVQLNLYYDLSSSGKYVLKCQRSTVIPGQKFDSPLESNEVEFEITSGSRFSPGDLVDPGCFDNPSKE